jgi:hypothetical protein
MEDLEGENTTSDIEKTKTFLNLLFYYKQGI